MKFKMLRLVSVVCISCSSTISLPPIPDAEADTVYVVESDAADGQSFIQPEGSFEGSTPVTCSGPSAGCGNLWCWPNCGVPGQGSGGTFGHQPM
jgi:hypothetical protein